MNLRNFVLQRVVQAGFVLLGLSIVIFLIARVVPGDPVRLALGARAPQWAVDKMRAEMSLDRPLYVQYGRWLRGAVAGDFGTSLVTRRPVVEDIREFLPATFELVLVAGLMESLLGIVLGIIAARYNNTWVDSVVRLLAYLGVVTPSFIFAIIFLLIFGYAWPVLPGTGRLTPEIVPPPIFTGVITLDSLLSGNVATFWDALKHLLLPATALAMGGMAQEARITRAAMIDNLRKDYVAMEKAQGIPLPTILAKYVLKPSLIPTVSIMGLDIAALFANAFLVELIFNWPGFSRYGITAMLQKDLNAISAVVLVLGVIFVTVTIVTDVCVGYLDPRIRLRAVRDV